MHPHLRGERLRKPENIHNTMETRRTRLLETRLQLEFASFVPQRMSWCRISRKEEGRRRGQRAHSGGGNTRRYCHGQSAGRKRPKIRTTNADWHSPFYHARAPTSPHSIRPRPESRAEESDGCHQRPIVCATSTRR